MNAVLDAALQYAAKGWHVLPLHGILADACTCHDLDCDSPGKHPIVAEGLLEATVHVPRIRAWFDTWRWANVGIACGPSNIAALDVDLRTGGLQSLERQSLDLRQSGKVATGDGFHLYFRGPAPTSVAHLGPGLDVRGIGGYVVAPPSRHISGNVYTWHRLGTDPLPTWPFPVTELPPQPPLGAALQPGSRNGTLFSIAGMLHMRAIPGPVIRTVLHAVNANHCQPPLAVREVDGIAAKVLRRPPRGVHFGLTQDGRAAGLAGPAAARSPWESATRPDAEPTRS